MQLITCCSLENYARIFFGLKDRLVVETCQKYSKMGLQNPLWFAHLYRPRYFAKFLRPESGEKINELEQLFFKT
jgi:hypothetical protein